MPVMTSVRTAPAAAVYAAAAALLLTGCGTGPAPGANAASATASTAAASPTPAEEIPRGDGSDTADDFNGDGHRDLLLDRLRPASGGIGGETTGIGVVYGSAHGLRPATRQLVTGMSATTANTGTGTATGTGTTTAGATAAPAPASAAARVSAGPAFDLDDDGYTDLVLITAPQYSHNAASATDARYEILRGGPEGPGTKRVPLRVPADPPRTGGPNIIGFVSPVVCGNFDGDGDQDLVMMTATSASRVHYLRGPFGTSGSPASSATPDCAVTGLGGARAHQVPAFTLPPEKSAGHSPGYRVVLAFADLDGDGHDDLVVRASRDGTTDQVAVFPGTADGLTTGPTLSFATSLFTGGS